MALSFQTLRQPYFLSNFQSPKFKFSVSGKKIVCLFDVMTKTYLSEKNVPLSNCYCTKKSNILFWLLLPKIIMKLKLPKMYFTEIANQNWYSLMKNIRIRMIWMFFDIENWLWMSKFPDFWRYCAILVLEVSRKTFCSIHFFAWKWRLCQMWYT